MQDASVSRPRRASARAVAVADLKLAVTQIDRLLLDVPANKRDALHDAVLAAVRAARDVGRFRHRREVPVEARV